MPGGFPVLPELCNCQDIGTVTATLGTLTTNGLAPTPGAWVQLTASSPIDASWIDISLLPTQNASTAVAWDVAIGPSGSEVIIAQSLVACSNTSRSAMALYSLPISIPAGTRIAIRSTGNNSADAGNACNIRLYDGDFISGGCAGVDAIGYNSSTVGGVTITGGTAGTSKGSYSQLIASTARDYVGFFIDALNGSANEWALVDLAIGGSGSEVPILSNLAIQSSPTANRNNLYGPFFVPIPAGSRLAARHEPSSTTGMTLDFILHGIYK